jgi:hypothetical protein
MSDTFQPTQSFGQELVGVRFNPSGLTQIDELKQWFADQIDTISDAFQKNPVQTINAAEAIRSLATACMWTVKFHVNR